MKDLMQQPIYNFFISKLDKIKEEIEQHNNFAAFLEVLDLRQKLASSDYLPFGDYQDILQQFNLTPIINQLISNIGNNREQVIQHLDQLKAYAHFLNFLECHYVSAELARKQTNTILSNTAIQLGVVFKEIRREMDCKDDMHVRVKEKEKEEDLPSPADSELTDYSNIIKAYIRFIGTEKKHISERERAREFARLLFEDLDEITPNSIRMQRLKNNEENLFCLADIEATITLSNTYKSEFKQQIQSEESELSLPSYAPRFS